MFERYTEKARRTIFFSRYEASQSGSGYIEPQHILLGLLREDNFLQAYFRSRPTINEIREQLQELLPVDVPFSDSIDLPISESAKRVLSVAAHEADRLQHSNLDTLHLLLAILKEENSIASRVLRKHRINVEMVEALLKRTTPSHSGVKSSQEQGIAGGVIGGVTGYVSGENFLTLLSEKAGLTELKDSFNRLLEMLVQKGLISEEEKRQITKPENSEN